MRTPGDAADQLARLLKHNGWFQKATVVEERDGRQRWHVWLRVYGFGNRPPSLRWSHAGLGVEWVRVHPQVATLFSQPELGKSA